VEWPLKYADLFKKADTKPPKGIILHGKPGTGKPILPKRWQVRAVLILSP